MDVLGLAHLADSFVLSKVRADILLWYLRPTACCLDSEWGFMLLAMEQLVLLPLFYSISTPLGSHWTLLDAIMSHFAQRSGRWTTCIQLTFRFLIFSSCSAYLRRYAGCLGAACIWMWTAISIAWMSTHWQATAMRLIALLTLLAAAGCRLQLAIWYRRKTLKKGYQLVIKHRRGWLGVAWRWLKPICRILAQLYDDSDLLRRCLINFGLFFEIFQ